jgi:hypothetical protein
MQRRSVGWLDCPADEFFRLLAMHEAGKINLLAMAMETADDEPEEVEEAPPSPPVKKELAHRAGVSAAQSVMRALASVSGPVTSTQIVTMTGLCKSTVNKQLNLVAVRAGTNESGTQLWLRK